MSNRPTYLLAAIFLFVLSGTAFLSMSQDSLTFDELAHIPAGYSYLTQKDYRLNPEHPPLIKDLSALPLLFLNLNFPEEHPTWKQEETAAAWWVQFDLGTEFLYNSGNSPRTIIFWSRLPMIFLLFFLGWFLFRWAREIGGNYFGLGVLALFAFSPNFIAHGRLVTNDVGATLGVVLATYFWLKFLKKPEKLNIFWAGIFLGIALIIKFSLILLIPFFALITLIYPLFFEKKNLGKYILKALAAGIIGFVFVIWPIYQFHIWNYPVEHQVRDTIADLAPNQIAPLKNLTIWMADKPLLRAPAQFFRGVLMASQRTIFGNNVYFLGEISASGWWYYFPIIYLLKVPLALHLLLLLALIMVIYFAIKGRIRSNFTILSFILFLVIYWSTAMLGNLNIGIRHLLPSFPFIYFLVMFGLKAGLSNISVLFLKRMLVTAIILLFGWYIFSSLSSFPYYIPYYNEIAGGRQNGYKYAVDSNYDWGQDFYRLLSFVESNNVEKIYLDYFGGENPQYWLGQKYIKLEPKETEKPPEGWVAVSVNQLQGGKARPTPGFDQSTGYYNWLDRYTPVARIGDSIFVYYIE